MSENVLYDHNCELAVIGSVLIDGTRLQDVQTILTPGDFYSLRHAYIYEAMLALAEKDEPIDTLTIGDELTRMKRFADIGGDIELANLMAYGGRTEHISQHARVIARYAKRRRWLKVADEIKRIALNNALLGESADDAIFAVLEEQDGVKADGDLIPLKVSINEYFDEIEASQSLPAGVTGLKTGYKDIDDLLDGLQPDSLNLLAGRPGMAKTAFGLNISLNVAKADGGVYYWSGEMSDRQMRERFMSVESGITNFRLRRGLRPGGLSPEDWTKFVATAGTVGTLPIWMDYETGITPARIAAKVKRLHRRHGLKLIVLDYINLMEAGRKTENTEKELSYISKRLKALALQTHVPILCLAQLSRKVEDRADKRPQLADLRDSGSLEQNADTVLLLYRDAYYNENTEFPNRADVILAKNRHGATGVVSLHFDKTLTKFSDGYTTTIDLRAL